MSQDDQATLAAVLAELRAFRQEVSERSERVEGTLARHGSALARIESQMGSHGVVLDQIDRHVRERLDRLEDRVDELERRKP